jgi:hypothetical protein
MACPENSTESYSCNPYKNHYITLGWIRSTYRFTSGVRRFIFAGGVNDKNGSAGLEQLTAET